MAQLGKYGPADEGTHAFEGIDKFNESMMANFIDPVSRLGGIVRVGNRPTLGYAEASVELFLPDGSVAYRSGRVESTDNDEFSSQGMRFEVVTPAETLRLTYKQSVAHIRTPTLLPSGARRVLKGAPADECEIDLEWHATSPMFSLDETGDGSPGSSVVATDHYEQFGTVSGTVRFGSRTWQLDGVRTMRDHSWGPREWASYYGEFLCLYFADGSSVTALREVEDDGSRSVTGTAHVGGQVRRVTDLEVFGDYAGGPSYDGRYQAVLHVEGCLPIPLDGTIRTFVPLTQATGDRGVRLAQMMVDFVGPDGAWAYAEYLRPVSS